MTKKEKEEKEFNELMSKCVKVEEIIPCIRAAVDFAADEIMERVEDFIIEQFNDLGLNCKTVYRFDEATEFLQCEDYELETAVNEGKIKCYHPSYCFNKDDNQYYFKADDIISFMLSESVDRIESGKMKVRE